MPIDGCAYRYDSTARTSLTHSNVKKNPPPTPQKLSTTTPSASSQHSTLSKKAVQKKTMKKPYMPLTTIREVEEKDQVDLLQNNPNDDLQSEQKLMQKKMEEEQAFHQHILVLLRNRSNAIKKAQSQVISSDLVSLSPPKNALFFPNRNNPLQKTLNNRKMRQKNNALEDHISIETIEQIEQVKNAISVIPTPTNTTSNKKWLITGSLLLGIGITLIPFSFGATGVIFGVLAAVMMLVGASVTFYHTIKFQATQQQDHEKIQNYLTKEYSKSLEKSINNLNGDIYYLNGSMNKIGFIKQKNGKYYVFRKASGSYVSLGNYDEISEAMKMAKSEQIITQYRAKPKETETATSSSNVTLQQNPLQTTSPKPNNLTLFGQTTPTTLLETSSSDSNSFKPT